MKTILYACAVFLLLSIKTVTAADFTNSLSMRFKDIPAGTYIMGSCKLSVADKKARFIGLPANGINCPFDQLDIEMPAHKIAITKSYQLGVHEVTLGQFKRFIDDSGGYLLTPEFKKYNNHGDNSPVVHVSWQDTQTFIQWLNKKEGGDHYRLPTEAEWEYAARAGANSIYSWGNHKNQINHYAWFRNNADESPHVVGRKQSNPWGLHDMHGNVWEWVQDFFEENYYLKSPTNDPKGPSSGQFRVNRGGSWINNPKLLRSAYRNFDGPNFRALTLGFRLLREP